MNYIIAVILAYLQVLLVIRREACVVYPDVMTIGDVSKFTGYGLSSVAMWCNKNRLRYFDMGSRYMIPKPYLLDFIMGPYFKGMKVKRAERVATTVPQMQRACCLWRIDVTIASFDALLLC